MRRRWRYRADGSKYEVTGEPDLPRSAQYIGDRTLEKRMAAQGKVPMAEYRNIAADAASARESKFKAQKRERVQAVVNAAKRVTGWL